MGYVIVVLGGLIFGLLSCIYMNVFEVVKYKLTDDIKAKHIFVPVSKKRMAYNILGVAAIIALGIEMRIMFSGDSCVHQLKLQFLISVIFALAFIDYRHRIVPNVVLLFCLAVRILFLIGEFIWEKDLFFGTLKTTAIGLLIFAVFFVICYLITKGGIGMGDLKLFMVIVLFQGLEYSLTSIFMSLLICFVVSLVLLASKKKKVKDTLPLVPCILAGTFISVALTGM